METHSHQLLETTTSTMNQMMGPVMEAVQNLSMAQQQTQAWMMQQQAILAMMNTQQQAIITPVGTKVDQA